MTYASPLSQALLGRTPEQLIEAWQRTGRSEDGLGHLRLYVRRCARTEPPEPVTWRTILPSGEERWVQSHAQGAPRPRRHHGHRAGRDLP